MAVAGWPGARRHRLDGAEAVIGDLAALEAPLPEPSAGDLADAGRRRGETLRLFLCRRAVLRLLAGRVLDRPPVAVEIGYGPRGAPLLRRPRERLFVSVAARGTFAGFALARRPVGVDVEPLADPGPIDAAWASSERVELAAAPEPVFAALRFWTAKEAYLKAIGTGLSRDPAAIEVVRGPAPRFAIRDAGLAAPGRGAWLVAEGLGTPIVAALWAAA